MTKEAGGGGAGGTRSSGIAGGTAWDREQRRNAAIIISVGQKMGMSRRDIVIGLMTAMQESGLRNVNYGDRDSKGLFQQRPSQGWGTEQQVRDPHYASKKFFQGLKGVKGRDRMSLTAAAQAVQRSAYPDAYAKWEGDARAIMSRHSGKIQPQSRKGSGWMTQDDAGNIVETTSYALPQGLRGGTETTTYSIPAGLKPERSTDDSKGAAPPAGYVPEVDTSISGGGGSGSGAMGAIGAPGLGAASDPLSLGTGMPQFGSVEEYTASTGGGRYGQKGVNNTRRAIVDTAKGAVGVPYKWGGTDLNAGVDCSGFIQSVYKEMGIDIPRVSYQQANYGKRVGLNKLRPGDLVAWDNSSRNDGADHIAIYLGNGKIIEAPRRGLSVRIRKLGKDEGAWGVAMDIK